jgi:hypothetical protein
MYSQYLTKLDNSRASDEDSLIEVGVAVCAVDRLLGNDGKPSGGDKVRRFPILSITLMKA